MNRHASHFKKTLLLCCFALLISGAGSEGSCFGPETEEEPQDSPPSAEPRPTTGCNAEQCPTGCCYANQCYGGKDWNACGAKGLDCALCAGINSCSAEQKCEYVETAKWRVQPLEASIVPLDPDDNSAWDIDGSAPDVVVELRCPQLSSSQPFIARTEEVTSLNPKWSTGDCRVELGALLEMPTEILFFDIDNIIDDPIGVKTYKFEQAEIERGEATIEIPGRVNSMTLRLIRVP